ncbi:IS110 family transposase [Cohnella silvisoli]|uniref:IS110 family transposase n=1 Tax=Cohnella silvisoli TaxID=2873699 RepID=A0ABV1KRH6_9BACL|nr:IS110 family transposase [Cohnella silvisoli]MCD9021745.1 IS110 family transposase [Cohnella silvisoli]
MDAVRKVCAGLDVHQKNVVACILTGPLEGKPTPIIQSFGTTTRELLELQDWLEEHECRDVAMESTGVLWKPVWNILESTCELVLANPQHIKNLPGRKTDIRDAQWIAQLHRCGLIEPSMVPQREVRELRDKTRYRRKLVQNATAEKNRIHKILQDANIKLTSFITDLFGVSGRALLNRLIDGEVLEEAEVRTLVKARLKGKVPLLMDALNGKLLKHHREMIQYHMEHLTFLEAKIGRLEENIQVLVEPYHEEVRLLDTIPGIEEIGAITLLAEISPNVAEKFPSDARLASWVGVCPGNNESAGIKKNAKSRNGNKHAKSILCQAAWANAKSNSRIGEYFRRIRKRRGEQKAAVATSHLILRIAYAMLKDRIEYKHIEPSIFQIPTEKMTERLTNQLKLLGYEVELRPTGTH